MEQGYNSIMVRKEAKANSVIQDELELYMSTELLSKIYDKNMFPLLWTRLKNYLLRINRTYGSVLSNAFPMFDGQFKQ